MADAGSTIALSFAFQRPLDTWARWFAIVPSRSFVRVDDDGFEAVYGQWRVATTWSNVADVECTGPYRAWKVAGPVRVSLADRGLTMAATTRGGVCLRFREPVKGVEPFGVLRHPTITLGMSDNEEFVRLATERIAAHRPGPGGGRPPAHRRGQLRSALGAVWRWNRRHVDHRQGDVESIDLPDHDRAGDADDQPIEVGTGPTFHRRYEIVVRNAVLGPDEAMAAIRADPNVLADVDLAPFTKARGVSGEMQVGDRYVIGITGPWKGAVEVIAVDSTSFRLSTLEGHLESGLIEMRTGMATGRDGRADVVFTIESWARSHDRFLDLMYDKLGIARALQAEMWAIACDRFCQLVRGEQVEPIEVVTERAV